MRRFVFASALMVGFLLGVSSRSEAQVLQVVPGTVFSYATPFGFAALKIVVKVDGHQALVISALGGKRAEFLDLSTMSDVSRPTQYSPKPTNIDSVLLPVRLSPINPLSEVTHFEAHRVWHEVANPLTPNRIERRMLTTSARLIGVGGYMSDGKLMLAEAIPVKIGETYFDAIERFNEENKKTKGFRALNARKPIDFLPLNAVIDPVALADQAKNGGLLKQGLEYRMRTPVKGEELGQLIDFEKAAAKIRGCKAAMTPTTPPAGF